MPSGTLALGPLDDTVLNPVGFTRRPTVPAAHLRPVAGGQHLLQVRAPGATDVVVDSRAGLGDGHVEQLRPYTGVHVDWEGGDGPVAYARVVAGLAMAGVPLTADPVPAWARALLVPALVAELDRDADLADDLDREVRSIRLRRAALAGHGAGAWRRGAADAVDVRTGAGDAGLGAAHHPPARDARARAAPGGPPAGRRPRAAADHPRLRRRTRRSWRRSPSGPASR